MSFPTYFEAHEYYANVKRVSLRRIHAVLREDIDKGLIKIGG